MPTIEQKLELLDKLILDGATRSRDAILEQLRQDSDQKLADQKADIDRRAEEEYRRESSKASQEREARVSRAHIDARKSLMAARSEIINSVLDDLKSRFDAFTRTAAYHDYLVKNVAAAAASVSATEIKAPADPVAPWNHTASVNPTDASVPAASPAAAAVLVSIYLTPRDHEAYAAEFARLSPGVDLRKGEADMIGGCRAENVRAHMYVDNSFKKKVELSIDELYAVSGLEIGIR